MFQYVTLLLTSTSNLLPGNANYFSFLHNNRTKSVEQQMVCGKRKGKTKIMASFWFGCRSVRILLFSFATVFTGNFTMIFVVVYQVECVVLVCKQDTSLITWNSKPMYGGVLLIKYQNNGITQEHWMLLHLLFSSILHVRLLILPCL